jgi:hypothetical protein
MKFKLIIVVLLFAQYKVFSQISLTPATVQKTGRFATCPSTSGSTVNIFYLNNLSTGGHVSNDTFFVDSLNGNSFFDLEFKNLQWNQTPNAEWLHGLYLGVDAPSVVTPVSAPVGFMFSNIGSVGQCPTGIIGKAGYYFDNTAAQSCCSLAAVNDSIPDNNYGDISWDCGATGLTVKFRVKIRNCLIDDSLMGFKLIGTSDGATGCWTSYDTMLNSVYPLFKVVNNVSANLPSFSLSATGNICYGDSMGTVTMASISATAPYSIAWSSGAVNLTALQNLPTATYTCTLTDANFCKATQTTIVSGPTLPLASITNYNSCAGDTILFNGLAYNTDTIFTQIFSSALGCDSAHIDQLRFHPNYSIPRVKYICDGESTIINGIAYNKDTVVKVDFMSSRGCDSSIVYTVIVLPKPNATVYEYNNLMRCGTFLNIQWAYCNPFQIINGAIDSFIAPIKGKEYAVIVSNVNQCIDTSDCVLSTSVNDWSANQKLAIQNFGNNQFMVRNTIGAQITLLDINGKTLRTMYCKDAELQLKLNDVAAGVYLLTAKNKFENVRQLIRVE